MTQPTQTQQEILQQLQAGLSHHVAGRLDQAEPIYRRVLAAEPAQPDGLHLLGVLELQRGHAAVALQLLTRAVALLPQVGEFHRHFAEALAANGRREEALQSYGRAIQLSPNDAAAYAGAGEMLLALDRLTEAIDILARAAQLQPKNPILLGNWGSVLTSAGRIPEALGVFQHALNIDPNSGPVWIQLGEALWHQRRFDEALSASRRAVELAPNDSRSFIILGNTQQVLADFDEAERAYRDAARIAPNSPDVYNNLGLTLLKMGRAKESLDVLERAHARWPDHIGIGGNLSLALLTLGDFERGWEKYEMRWRTAGFAHYGKYPQPMWDGGEVAGKTILLTMEQGIGDAIQFVRYAPLLAERVAKVLVACRPELSAVISTVPGVAAAVTSDPGPFDVHAPLASLPRLFKTTQATIPANVPYVFADEARVSHWRENLAAHGEFKVGLAWAGNPTHQNDRSRSASLAAFAPLAQVKGATFFSLQKGEAARELVSPPSGLQLIALGEQLNDYADTAALLQCLDLVISVDTSVVHLAGALARAVWTLLAAGPDWRWMMDREDSPWYPTMRLFRQSKPGDWLSVFDRVANELKDRVTTPH